MSTTLNVLLFSRPKLPLTILIIIGFFANSSRAFPRPTDYDIWNRNATVSETDYRNNSSRSGKVLNFFPIPVEEECTSLDGHRKGVCMNTYECRIQGGKSSGTCALGFGVCCVFMVTCGTEIANNITYFVNPDFPRNSRQMSSCEIKIKKIDPVVSQFRLDFIHFHLGQPNRQTGVCDDDVFVMHGKNSFELKLCGHNSGQHVYYDVENIEDPVKIQMKLNKRSLSRLWEVRIIQVPMSQRAPTGCLQYHTGLQGIVQTMNFADNGRHLANQDYNICMRQEANMCSIAYQPCYENSFRIGPVPGRPTLNSGTIFPPTNGVTPGSPLIQVSPSAGPPLTQTGDAPPLAVEDDTAAVTAEEEIVGSGDGAVQGRMSRDCNDKIIMPCDADDFIMPGLTNPGMCELIHCGASFCPPDDPLCRVESSVTPFQIGVQFGAPSLAKQESPEDNLGMCLFYEQLPCAV